MICLTDIMQSICNRTSKRLGYKINFQFGDWPQIARIMETLSKSQYTESTKYPLVALFTPFEEDKTDPNYYAKSFVNIMIATRSLPDYTNEQRLEVSYKGLLYPVYEAIFDEIKKDRSFDFGYDGIVKHKYSDNMRYGSHGVYGSDGKRPFADYFDGIDISGLELKIKNNLNCRLK